MSCYETSGLPLDHISESIGIGSDIHGVAFEEESTQYLWVSNQTTDELYRIDLEPTGIEGSSSSAATSVTLCCDHNPFQNSVLLQGSGFSGHAVLEIFDIYGRKILSERFTESYLWDAESAFIGAYFARVSDSSGNSAFIRLIKI